MTRLLVLLAILAALGLVALWLRRRPRALTRRLAHTGGLRGLVPPGRPAILAFASTDCAVCRSAQRPALDEVAATLGEVVTVREVDIVQEPALARAFTVFTVPSTVVLDGEGRVVAFNAGYAPPDRLRRQVLQAGRSSSPRGEQSVGLT